MASMFGIVSSLGIKRDDYGVGDLLAQVSKRSASMSAEDRQEIADMTKRLRQHKPNSVSTPRQTPDNSQHDGRHGNNKRDFGKDLLKVDDLLRGFGNSTSPIEPIQTVESPVSSGSSVSPPASPSRVGVRSSSSGVLLRGFGPSPSTEASEELGDGALGFERVHNL